MKVKSLIALFAGILLCFPAYSQSNGNILKVRGEATVEAVPAQMIVSIPINVKDESYEACNTKLTRAYNNLSDALQKAGIEKAEIKSNRLNINEDYQYIDRERKLVGYRGSISVKVEMPHKTKKMQAIMETLNDDRFNFGYSLSFELSEAQKDSLSNSAMTKSVDDARTKAETLTKALDLRLIEIHEVSYGYVESGPSPLTRNYDMAMKSEANSSEPIELNPDKMQVQRQVSVIWTIAK